MLLLVLALADTALGPGTVGGTPVIAAASVTDLGDQTPAAAPPPESAPAVATAPATSPGAAPTASTPAPPSADAAEKSDADAYTAQAYDPWVKVNRKIFTFDIKLEKGLLAPVAHGYQHAVPHAVRFHITNALNNLDEPLTAANDLLQLRIGSMAKATFRFIVNSTVGIGGLFDVGAASGIPLHVSDFGQTLGRYGVKPGPYVVLPLLGPSSVRDGVGRLVDNFIDPLYYLLGNQGFAFGAGELVAQGIDWRARSDDTMKVIYEATDPYATTRSLYSQSRADAVAQATGKQAALPSFDAPPGTP